ncbi:MAG: stage II sporulation protein M [Vicinamibacterales bacterium]
MSRWRLVTASVLFGIGLAFGLLRPPVVPRAGTVTTRDIVARSHRPPSVRWLVRRNLRPFGLLALGIVLGGLPTCVSLVGLGFVVAVRVADVAARVSLPLVAASVVPHALPELAAYIVGGAGGLGGLAIVRALARGDGRAARATLVGSARLIGVGFVLLVAAACVEHAVTPVLIRIAAQWAN